MAMASLEGKMPTDDGDHDDDDKKNNFIQDEEKTPPDLGNEQHDSLTPHAFHWNLPDHHRNHDTNIPNMTRFAHAKARAIVQLCHSIQLTPSLFEQDDTDRNDDSQQDNSRTESKGQTEDENDDDDDDGAMLMDDDDEEEEDEMDVEEELPGGDGANIPSSSSLSSNQKKYHPETLDSLLKRCYRLSSQTTAWEGFKYGGISQQELAEMILHLTRLVTTCLIRTLDGHVELWTEPTVGYIQYHVPSPPAPPPKKDIPSSSEPINENTPPEPQQDCFEPLPSTEELKQQLKNPFALPSPARESLLSVLSQLLSNKGPLRSASNAALFPFPNNPEHTNDDNAATTHTGPPLSLVLHWQVLLRLLLRTVPALDEYESDPIPQDSSSRVSTVQKRTVQFIRDARRFFPSQTTASQVWTMVRSDTLYHSHTHACYRGTILLYLFLPSASPPEFYRNVLPEWLNAWTNIDRCPEYDFLWMALFCRARKFLTHATTETRATGEEGSTSSPDWATSWCWIRRRLLTLCQYWCLLPIGGTAPDKSWIQAPHPRSRACPSKLKALATAGSSYEEGIDFVAKIAKLLVASLGGNDSKQDTGLNNGSTTMSNSNNAPVSEGTADILRFLTSVAPYYHPSNLGSWTFTLGAFLHYFCYELACRVGTAAGLQVLQTNHSDVYRALAEAQPAVVSQPDQLSPHEVVTLVDALVPLCQQALYSKNSHVSRASEAAMLYLVQIDPQSVTPVFHDFCIRALDIQAVHSAHQAPAALSALCRLIQPTLRRAPVVLLHRLPTILRLTLAGIDSNDQNKSIRTLIFYRNLASWLPIGTNPRKTARKLTHYSAEELEKKGVIRIGSHLLDLFEQSCHSEKYRAAVAALPSKSLLTNNSGVDDLSDMENWLEETGVATGDWVLEFLERVFELLRASGEREKASKRSSGVASRHSSADVNATRNFSRVLKESLSQVFVAMDEETFHIAALAVKRFVEEESLPAAAKDVSLLCQAVASARGMDRNPGLDMLVPMLTDDLSQHSTKTIIYRVRSLAGSVRYAGKAVLRHKEAIQNVMKYCFASEDRAVFKTGCKLLRHVLATLTEPYPLPADSKPRVFIDEGSNRLFLGRSAELVDDPIQWHIPDAECVEFAWEILKDNVMSRLEALSSSVPSANGSPPRSCLLNVGDVQSVRRCLRLARYAIRGGASVLLDEELSASKMNLDDPKEIVPHETACHRILEQASAETKKQILAVRRRLCSVVVVLASIIGSDTLHPGGLEQIESNDMYRKTIPLISRDAKICKETCDMSLLLLTRRGAYFRSQEAMTVWKAQKQFSSDYTLSAQVSVVEEALQAAGILSPHLLFKDGEDGGRCMPRRLIVTRIHLFHSAMIRNASFEVPRRMRRQSTGKSKGERREILFKVGANLPEMLSNLENVLQSKTPRPLDGYEGILDGLHALCCHSNTQVRASAIGVVDYALTRFGWFLKPRINRLLGAMSLQDAKQNGKFGIPSCALLVDNLNNQGKRKRLSEAMKGVSSILSLQRTTKFILMSHKLRRDFMQSLCETDKVISLMPTEETQKMIHYIHNVFSPFRSKTFRLPRTTKQDEEYHASLLQSSIDFLLERKRTNGVESSDESSEKGAVVHWRKQLQACWFLLVSLDQEDVSHGGDNISESWTTCIRLIESEKGQPLQRVALGLFAKLSFLSEKTAVESSLGPKLLEKSFCRTFADALVYDHKEDSSYGGGHQAQWSAGVEDIIREASRVIAPRNLFPFQRTSLASGSFKVAHSHLLTHILSCLAPDKAQDVICRLLDTCKEMIAAPPNEDQKNQQVTSAEIFAGICRYYMTSELMSEELWTKTLLPHFEEAVQKLPFTLTSSYSDALRFSLQFCNPSLFQPLIEFVVQRIVKSIWQPAKHKKNGASPTNGSAHGTDGFNAQSKWLYLTSSVLVELDITESDTAEKRKQWYQRALTKHDCTVNEHNTETYQRAWDLVKETLMPRLLEALGHPFHNCRDHIARLLFRICNCNRKRNRVVASRSTASSTSDDDTRVTNDAVDSEPPGSAIVRKIAGLHANQELSFLDKYNGLNTARRFLSYCLHLGEAKFELTDYVIPVLPTVFESLKSTVEESITNVDISQEEQAAWRALEAEVTKGFRYSVSEISQTSTSPLNMDDIGQVLDHVRNAACHETWQVRQASAHFLRCFHGAHKFLLTSEQTDRIMVVIEDLLADERREVSAAALAAVTGLLTGLPMKDIAVLVDKYVGIANRSKIKRKKGFSNEASSTDEEKELKRVRNQQISVFFLCAAILAQPYETPSYVPVALSAISKHSFERSAPLSIRDTVKRCCAEYKRTHMSDNWEEHRRIFTQEQIEALEDVVSTPHYYA